MNIKNEFQTLADRCVSAFKLLQDNNTSMINVSMYAYSLYDRLGVVNKIESAKDEAVTEESVKEYNKHYIEKGSKMITIPYNVFKQAVKLAELQRQTMDILYSGKGNIIDYSDYKKECEKEQKEMQKIVEEINKSKQKSND